MAVQPLAIALLVDDPTPVVHLYRHHVHDLERRQPPDAAGRPLAETVPNAFLSSFCEVVAARGIRGKFSIVPSPMGRGDVVRGVEGHDPVLTREWIATAASRLTGRMDFSPEMITHSWALDLPTGTLLPETEHDWSQRQDRATLTPYLTRALTLLKEAGVDATGVTSPWMFAEKVEAEYRAAIAAAQRRVHGRALSWYCLHYAEDRFDGRPEAHRTADGVVVSTPFTVSDRLWGTIWDSARTDRRHVADLADGFLTASGHGGALPRVRAAGGWAGLGVHWQCLWSNGRETGLRVLDLVARRVKERLGAGARWTTCLEAAGEAARAAGSG